MISVVVPIYNVEKYLDKCINSILNQTYRDLEIVLVDDGSPDRCGIICDHYATIDPRVRVIHKVNGGLSDARNKGIDFASGEYITFIDSDDFIHPQMLEILYYNIVIEDADISVCDFFIIKDGSIVTSTFHDIDEITRESYVGSSVMEQLEYHNLVTVVSWNKLYRKKLFKGLRYPKGKLHEDEFIIHRILHSCKKSVYTPEKLYYYLQREGSITDKLNCKLVADGLEAYIDRVNYLHQNNYMRILTLTKIQVLQYIVKYYESFHDVKEAAALLNDFNIIFNEYFYCKEVQNYLGKEMKGLYKRFVKNPQTYYNRIVYLKKRDEYLGFMKNRIKCLLKW